MEKLTISNVTADREVQTKYGLKKKQGVQFQEYGTLWHDLWGGGHKKGEILEGTRESREYEGKTYWTFKLPNKESAVIVKLEEILIKLGKMGLDIQQIKEATKPKEQGRVPTEVEYPDNDLDTSPF